MTTAILATAFTVGLITGGGLLLFFRRARAGGGSLPVKAAVVEHSPAGTLILDPNLSVTFANEAFCHFFTLAADQVVGRGIQDILDTRLKAVVEQPDIFESREAPTSSLFETEGWNEADSRLAARRNQTRMRSEAPLVDRNGKVHPVQVISSPIQNPDGDVTGVVDAITDLAELQGLRSEEAGAKGS